MKFSLSYFKFLMRSTNQHGIHSPFVYALVTKCLYKKNKPLKNDLKQLKKEIHANIQQSKNVLIINKIVSYLDIKNILIVNSKSSFLTASLKKNRPKTIVSQVSDTEQAHPDVFDAIYIDDPNILEHISAKELDSISNNDSVVIVNNIHCSNNTVNQWRSFTESGHITVSIDLYYLGLIFFRKEQQKEHFVIRV